MMSTNRNQKSRFTLLLCTAAMVLPLWAGPALAQNAPEAEEENSTEIIVTAQRRNERLEDVPMSVAVVTQESLANSGINTVRDLQNVTTGFLVNNSGNTPQPAIRGITTTNAGAYENNVALFVDGLYQAAPQVLNMDLPNVQDIQILKGPQGTLYGRNATGGAILINTIDPGNETKGMAEASYARFNDYRTKAFISMPLGDSIGFSIAGTLRHTDGYYKQVSRTTPGAFVGNFLGLRQESVRTKLKLRASETFSATLAYNYLHTSDPRGVVFAYIENVAAPFTGTTGNATRPRNLGEAGGDVSIVDLNMHEGSLKLELDTGIGKLRSVTGYSVAKLNSTFDFGGSYVPDSYSRTITRDRTWQENIDFAIDAIDNLDLVLGGNFYQIKTDFGIPSTAFGGPAALGGPPSDPANFTVPLTDYKKLSETYFFRTKSAWALFADATFKATDQLSINLGGRYSKERQDVSGYKLNFSPVTGLPTTCAYSIAGETVAGLPCGGSVLVNGVPTFELRSSAKQSSYSKFTPRASIRYEITPGTNIYATYSKGFRAGEWNGVIPGDNPARWFDAKQESVNAFELGFKTVNSRLRFELAGFYYDYTDLQVSNTQVIQSGTPPVATPLVLLANAPKAKIYGLEGNIDFKVNDNLNLRAGATWLHARYGDGFVINAQGVCLNTAIVCPGGTVLGTGQSTVGFNVNTDPLLTYTNKGLDQNLSGLQMSRAPDFTGFIGFDYLVPMDSGGLRFAANLKYTTSYVVTNPNVWGGDERSALARAGALPDNTRALAGTPFAAFANVQRSRQEAFALLNASVTWTDPSDSYYVRIWGNNLTDVKYRVHYTNNGNGTYAPIGEPLSFGGTVGVKF